MPVRLTTQEPSRAGPLVHASLDHLDELRCPPGDDSGDFVRHHVDLLLNRQVLNSSMLHPNHTPTRAATGGGFVPNEENQTKNEIQPIKSSVRTIQPTRLIGRVSRRSENKPETMTNVSPVKNHQRPLMDKTTEPTINSV